MHIIISPLHIMPLYKFLPRMNFLPGSDSTELSSMFGKYFLFYDYGKSCDRGSATKTGLNLKCGYFIQLNEQENPETT